MLIINMILHFLAELQSHLDITIDAQKFLFFHGYPDVDHDAHI